ncbi:MAG: ATP-dependent DNA helicase RecG [Planctomycetota bacterium]
MPESSPITYATPIGDLPGVGDRRLPMYHRLGLRRVADLLRHVPLRYENHAASTPIDSLLELAAGAVGAARGVVEKTRWNAPPGRGRKGRFEATLQDDSGTLLCTWFNAAWLRDRIAVGMTLDVQGKVKTFQNYPQMVNPKWSALSEEAKQQAPNAIDKLQPIYPATDGLPSAAIAKLIETVLDDAVADLDDPVPDELRKHHAMPTLGEAFRKLHRPETKDDHQAARRRLAFNELLLLQLGIALKRAHVRHHLKAHELRFTDAIDAHIRQRFPFPLTRAQDRVTQEIANDLQRPWPMNRLLQGDVGAGKTVIALYAMLLAVADRKQAALMAPTELLAEQHFASIAAMLEGSGVSIDLFTSNRPGDRDALASGALDIAVGTHALLSESMRFHELAVAVVDEQHRFGVKQRAALRSANPDSDQVPHTLVMTATPIPRTLSLTLFGDLDVSTLDELPPGRTPATNRVVTPLQAEEVYGYAATRLKRGEQAYVVVPTIDGKGAAGDELKSVNAHAAMLQQRFFADFEVGVVHGRLTPEQRQAVMEDFRANRVRVLVATTVIEVGVDVPNATVMVIEHAERFGLAQLHQLRGRIGRGTNQKRPLCVFIADPTTEDASKRLDAIASTNDGFKIAEHDLSIRGMGDFFGTRQAGAVPLRLATIPEDLDLLKLAGRDAEQIVADDPTLADPKHALLRKVLLQQHGEALGLIDVG